jgi:hypothetical protein
MTFSELTDSTYIVYAMKHYDNPQCESIEEFHEDLNRTKYLKRLFRKYNSSGVLRERLILNHIIIFYNTFGVEASTRLLFYRIEEDLHPLLKTFLVYLNYLPEKYDIPECALVSIPLHNDIIQQLRDI